ncbi:MAG: methyltransferase [Firmicutes bacterium HGW-Firmicutes-13]|nr:MAG: methyltransferase [Firmicutes bacterium HGW-Firmicutes-13]
MSIETKEEFFQLPGREIKLLVVKDIEALVTDPDDEDQIPYWADIWPAGRAMANYIWEKINFQRAEVLELGAGLGLPGIVAALKGAKVTFSDYKDEAVQMTACNARANGLQKVDTFTGDWRDFRLEKKFDWILGSDILYNPRLNPYAEKILVSNLKADGQLLISHARRPATYEVLERLKKEGPFMDTVNLIPITIEDPYYPNYMISLHHLRRN